MKTVLTMSTMYLILILVYLFAVITQSYHLITRRLKSWFT
jgi:hypothetical protein